MKLLGILGQQQYVEPPKTTFPVYRWSPNGDSQHYEVLNNKYEALDPRYAQGTEPKRWVLNDASRILGPIMTPLTTTNELSWESFASN
jgi:hypothetical protein